MQNGYFCLLVSVPDVHPILGGKVALHFPTHVHPVIQGQCCNNNNNNSYIALYPVKIYKLAALYIINIKIH